MCQNRVAEVVRRHKKGLRRKVLTWTNILYFVAIEDLGKKVLFGTTTVFLGQEVHYYIVYIAYYTELNLQICNYAFVAKIVSKNFFGHFCPCRKAANFCHPGPKSSEDPSKSRT